MTGPSETGNRRDPAVGTPYVDPELYDLVYASQTADVEFYVEEAKRAGGPVLEIGCGTGRILIPSLQAGADIDGLDREPAMLERLRAKAEVLGLRPAVFAGDMRDFTMPRRYRLITIPFRAFMHLRAIDDQLHALLCVREHLEPGGRLLMDQFYPSFARMVENEGKQVLQCELTHPESGLPIAVYDTPRYDRVNQLLAVEREVVESDARGYASRTRRYAFTLRWTFRHEMELLLRAAGFAGWQVAGGFDGRPLERDTDEMVWTAWKD